MIKGMETGLIAARSSIPFGGVGEPTPSRRRLPSPAARAGIAGFVRRAAAGGAKRLDGEQARARRRVNQNPGDEPEAHAVQSATVA